MDFLKIHIYAPNCHQRQDIIIAICRDLELNYMFEDVKQVAEMTPGYVGADLNLLCREAFYFSQVKLLTMKSKFNHL